MATPFSTSDEAIINEVLPLSNLTLTSTSSAQRVPVSQLYDTKSLSLSIIQHGFKAIALQFPDELLCDSSEVLWAIQADLKNHYLEMSAEKAADSAGQSMQRAMPQLFILADTSYGNCCVDEVAAAHVNADLVIHFGHACLSL